MIDTGTLRQRIIDAAIRGQLTEQLESDGTANELLEQIILEKQKLQKAKLIRKAKPLPSISKEEIPFAIPKNWVWVKFGNVISLKSGQDLNKTAFNSDAEGIPYLTGASNVDNDGRLIINRWTLQPKSIAKRGDLLITCKGTVGKLAVLDVDTAHIARQFMAITAIGFDIEYARVFMDAIITGLKAREKGLIPGIERSDVLNLCFPLPPLAEQKRIVERVNTLFIQLGIINEAQLHFSTNIVVMRERIIEAGITGQLTEQLESDGTANELLAQIIAKKQQQQKAKVIRKTKPLPAITQEEAPFKIPDNWVWVHLDDITSKICSGNTPAGGRKSNVYVDEGFSFFREQNIYNDGIREDGMVFITEELLATRPNSTVLAKDILLNITGGSIGRCALVPDDFDRGSINQHILIIRLVDERLRFYIHRLICSPYAQKYIRNKAVGDKDGFSGGRCKQMPIPLPPLAEQERIATRIDELLDALPL